MPRIRVIDDPLLEQGGDAIETPELIPLHARRRGPALGAADGVCRPDRAAGPVCREVPRVVRCDALGVRVGAVRDAGREGARLERIRRLRIGGDRDMTLPAEGVAPEGIAPLPQGDGRSRERGRGARGGDEVHAGDPHRASRSRGIRRQTGLGIVADDSEAGRGVTPHVHVARLERVDARVVEDGLSGRGEDEVAAQIDVAVGADHGSREIEQGGEGRDGEGVDEPVAGGISGLGDRDAETRGEEQLVEPDHRQHEAVVRSVVVEGGIRDDPEGAVRDGIATIGPEEQVEVRRGDDLRHCRELPARVVGLGPHAEGVVHCFEDVRGAHGDGAIGRLTDRRDLVDSVEAGDHGGRDQRAGTPGQGRGEDRRLLFRASQALGAPMVPERLAAPLAGRRRRAERP